jgi:ribosomal protein S18 acetylase RimI-like enzyme
MTDIEYTDTGQDGLDLIGPLWEKLNDQHRRLSPRHARHFEAMTFAKRQEQLLRKSHGGAIRINFAGDGGRPVGYCVSTVSSGRVGEVESIYVEPEYRGRGIGGELVKKALAWMDGLAAERKIIGVAAGNEEVIAFYETYGFYPRTIILEQAESAKS